MTIKGATMRRAFLVLAATLPLILSGGGVGAWENEGQQVPCDFVTGGGFIVGQGGSDLSAGAHGNFGVGGGVKNGAWWGHLEYNDHGSSMVRTVHGTGVTGYIHPTVCDTSSTAREIDGTCVINGSIPCKYRVLVDDLGEPGRDVDRFAIQVSVNDSIVYQAGWCFDYVPISGGNIQLHKGNNSNTPPAGTCG
jgi:hypothetical protein